MTPMGFRNTNTGSSKADPDDLDTTAVKVRELLRDAVSRQLVADVPVCTLLSAVWIPARSGLCRCQCKQANRGSN